MFDRNIVLLLMVAGIATAESIRNPLEVKRARQSRFNNGRILGGHTAEPGQFPHQISLRIFRLFHLGGGSILSERWIVTAAHCTYDFEQDWLTIQAGAHHITGDGDEYEIERIIEHPEYDNFHLYNDIALIELSVSLALSDRVAVIGYGTTTPIGVGVSARTSGWGQMDVSYRICV